jgi:hypothetical protein
LTDGPRLAEPFWHTAPNKKLEFILSPDIIYLVHPRDYTIFPPATQILEYLQPTDSRRAMVRAYRDRENRVAFYAIQFVPK